MNFNHSIFSAFRHLIHRQNASELLWVVFGQLASAVGSLVAVRVLTISLSLEAYGEFSLGNTIAVLFNQTLFGPLMNAYVRYWAIYKERQQTKAFLKVAVQLVSWLSLIFILISILVWLIFLKQAPKWAAISLFSSLFALVGSYVSILNGIQLAERQRKIVAWHQGSIPWIQMLVALLFLLLLTKSSSIAILGYLTGSCIVLISQLLLFQPILSTSKQSSNLSVSSKEIRNELISYASPFASWGILTWIQLVSDRWFLQVFYGEETVSFYTVLYQLGYQPIALTGSVFVQFMYPILFERAGDANNIVRVKNALRLWLKVATSMVVVALLGLMVIAIFHHSILQLFAAPEYSQFSYLLPMIMISSTLYNMAQITCLIPMLFSDSKTLLYPKIFTGVVAGILNFIFIFQFGLGGAIAANIASALFYLTWLSVACWRQVRSRLNQGLLI